MSIAYVDTSSLVAIAFDEPESAALAARLNEFTGLTSSNLLEAELMAAHVRADREFDPNLIARIEWILPERSLAPEIERALDAGYLRGADLWHVATALHFAPPRPRRIPTL